MKKLCNSYAKTYKLSDHNFHMQNMHKAGAKRETASWPNSASDSVSQQVSATYVVEHHQKIMM